MTNQVNKQFANQESIMKNIPHPLQKFRSMKFNGIPFQIPLRYHAKQLIGRGAYGQVISCQRTVDGEFLAIKKLESIFRHPIHAKRALREVKILKQLQHDGILDISDVFMDPTFTDMYLVSPLMDTDLHKVIRSSQPLIEKHIQFFIYQILRATLYMQSAGVIHRDLKPSNILVDLNCSIKIGDLGMAKVIDHNPNSIAPMTEYVATRWYRAPEIMMWKAYGFEVDVWSIGCILGELLCRRALFPGSDFQDQLRKIFTILGTPMSDFVHQIENPRILKWLAAQKYYAAQDLQKIFPKSNPLAIDLLQKMLQYSPYKRMSVALALQHPYLKDFHDPRTETVMQERVKFPYAVENCSMPQLREIVTKEIKYYAEKNNYRAFLGNHQTSSKMFMQANNNVFMPVINAPSKMAIIDGTPMVLTPIATSDLANRLMSIQAGVHQQPNNNTFNFSNIIINNSNGQQRQVRGGLPIAAPFASMTNMRHPSPWIIDKKRSNQTMGSNILQSKTASPSKPSQGRDITGIKISEGEIQRAESMPHVLAGEISTDTIMKDKQ